MAEANCRNCHHFVPVSKMPESLKQKAREWIKHNRPGQRLLGWCNAYRRPVTYYEGTCGYYKPKRKEDSQKLDIFLR